MGETQTRYHVAIDVDDRAGVLAAVAQTFAEHDVSIQTVRQEGRGDDAQLVVVSHRATRRGPRPRPWTTLRKLDFVHEVSSVMRVEGDAVSKVGTAGAPVARRHRGVPRPARAPRGHPDRDPARGRHAAGRQPLAVRAARCRGVAQGRGRQPDRLVQGPRHDGRALRRGRAGGGGGRLRVHGQHLGVDGGLRGAGPGEAAGAGAAGQDRGGQAGPGDRARRPGDHGPGQLRRLPAHVAGAGRALPGRPGELGEPDAHRGSEDGVLRDRGLPRRRTRRARAPGRQRGQHLGVLEGLPSSRRRPASSTRRPRMLGWQAAGAAPLVGGEPVAVARDGRLRDPDRQPRLVGARGRCPRPSRPATSARSTDDEILARPAGCWPRRTASSSSRRRPPAWPGCCRRSRAARPTPVSGSW